MRWKRARWPKNHECGGLGWDGQYSYSAEISKALLCTYQILVKVTAARDLLYQPDGKADYQDSRTHDAWPLEEVVKALHLLGFGRVL